MMGTKVDVFRLESIELLELDEEALLQWWWMVKRRIRLGFTEFFMLFLRFFAVFSVLEG
jgi:hypothetical protein